jgi:uncharacterized protein (TIGR01244 family)
MFLVLALTLLATQGQAPTTPADVPPIRNFMRVTPEFCTGGQPRLEHFAQLKSEGVRAVLNLRTPGEHRAAEEQEAVEKAGLKYFNIPVEYQHPASEQVDQFLKITDDPANRPMFIHCTAAIRVGAFWMIRRVLRDGFSQEAALEEARKVGLVPTPHLEEFVRTYLETHRTNPSSKPPLPQTPPRVSRAADGVEWWCSPSTASTRVTDGLPHCAA